MSLKGFPGPCFKEQACILSKTSFPSGSVGKESACDAGDPSSIPGVGRSPGEGNGNPFQYSCLGNPMDGGAWWSSLGWEDPLEKEMVTHSSIPAWEIPWTEEPGGQT